MTANDLEDLDQERIFYDHIREYLIYFTILIALYFVAYTLVARFSRPRDELGDDDTIVHRVSTWLCAFTLAISIGAALLLPFSIVVSCLMPESAASLLCGLWNYVFLFSNMSLFVILPFAYFFTESEGFSGSKRGIMARLRETLVLLILLSILVLGLTYIVCCCIGCQSLTVWQYLPFLYSCISFIGVLILLLCTPRGITRLFTVLNQMDTIRARNMNYVSAMIMLLALTLLALLLVFVNTIELLVGLKALPMAAMSPTFEQIKILSRRGPLGASLETVLILYLWCASLVGLYNLPLVNSLRPRSKQTSFNRVIGNCAMLCLLSSALPLLTRTVGITNFNLLGDFGRIEWLGSFEVVLLYNLVFIISTALCLTNSVTRRLIASLKLLVETAANAAQSATKTMTTYKSIARSKFSRQTTPSSIPIDRHEHTE